MIHSKHMAGRGAARGPDKGRHASSRPRTHMTEKLRVPSRCLAGTSEAEEALLLLRVDLRSELLLQPGVEVVLLLRLVRQLLLPPLAVVVRRLEDELDEPALAHRDRLLQADLADAPRRPHLVTKRGAHHHNLVAHAELALVLQLRGLRARDDLLDEDALSEAL